MKSSHVSPKNKPCPIQTLKPVEMFAGLSGESVNRFVQFCAEDTDQTHHMVIQNDAALGLELLPDSSVSLVFSSLPYGDLIDYTPDTETSSDSEIGGEDRREDFVARVEELITALFPKIRARGSVAFNINTIREGGRGVPGPNSTSSKTKRRVGSKWRKKRPKTLHDLPGMIMQIAERVGFIPRHEEIWIKKHCMHENVRDRSRQCHEYVIILDKSEKNSCERGKLTANGLPNDTSVFECPTSRANYRHPATFHPALPERYIHAMTKPGDIVLDLTAGVFTTALSAMKHFRNSVSIELYREYAETGINRLFHFAKDYKAKLYKPARFDLFAEEEEIEPIHLTNAKPLTIKKADTDYMVQYQAIERPKQLITHLKPEINMTTTSPFPVDCMPRVQQELINDLVTSSKADETIAATAVLIVWSAALGRSWTAMDPIRHAIDHPNLQGLVIAPTGAGKSAADKIAKPLYAAEAIAHRLKKYEEEPLPHYLLDTVTQSALLRQLERSDDTGFLFSSEAGGLIKSILAQSKRSAGNLFELLLKGFTVQKHRDDTMKHGTRATVPCLSQLLLAQPKVSKELISNADFIERGLANRWLLAEIPKPPLDFETSEVVQPNRQAYRDWHKLVRQAMRSRIIGSKKKVYQHTWSQAALGVFRDYHNRVISKLKSEWQDTDESLFGRSRELHKRIALGILAAEYYAGNEQFLKIDYNPALRAFEIINWFDERRIEIMNVAKQQKATETKRRLLDILATSKDRQKALRDLARYKNIQKEQVEEIAQIFPDLFEIKKVRAPEATAGRFSTVVRLRL